jgi:hypothetical protein
VHSYPNQSEGERREKGGKRGKGGQRGGKRKKETHETNHTKQNTQNTHTQRQQNAQKIRYGLSKIGTNSRIRKRIEKFSKNPTKNSGRNPHKKGGTLRQTQTYYLSNSGRFIFLIL